MKGLFICQRRFAVIAHAIAVALKKKGGTKNFCGYVYARSSLEYLKDQKDLTYDSLILDEDIHNEYRKEKIDYDYLNYLEKEYGVPNLWPYIALDRVVMYNQFVREYPYNTPRYSHEDMMRILQVKARRIIKMFDEEKPDFVFLTVVGAIGSMLIYQIAKKRNIKVMVGIVGRIGDLFLLSENHHDVSWADRLFEQSKKETVTIPQDERARMIIKNFRQDPTPYDEFESPIKKAVSKRTQLQFLYPKQLIKSIKWFFIFTWQYIKIRRHDDYDEIKPWYYIIDHIKRKVRCLIGFSDLYDQINFNEPYAFFPLQLDPEISTMLYAPFFVDQTYVIKQIARSLPIHYKLYVKEHPAMAGYRPRSFYKELKKIPNVKIISPEILSYPLIKNCQLITTITSTVGWEAILMGKPVITFGDVFYNKLEMVKRCKAVEELPYIIKNQLENFTYNEEELVKYISAMLQDGIEVPLVSLWEREIDNKEKIYFYCESIADLIIKKLNLVS